MSPAWMIRSTAAQRRRAPAAAPGRACRRSRRRRSPRSQDPLVTTDRPLTPRCRTALRPRPSAPSRTRPRRSRVPRARDDRGAAGARRPGRRGARGTTSDASRTTSGTSAVAGDTTRHQQRQRGAARRTWPADASAACMGLRGRSCRRCRARRAHARRARPSPSAAPRPRSASSAIEAALDVDRRQLRAVRGPTSAASSSRSRSRSAVFGVGLRAHRDVLAGRHRHRARHQPGDAGDQDRCRALAPARGHAERSDWRSRRCRRWRRAPRRAANRRAGCGAIHDEISARGSVTSD